MAVGKGGSNQDQNQSSSGSFTGTSNTSTTPIAPDGYSDAWKSILGMGGTTPGQDTANWFQQYITANGPDGFSGANGILENNLIPYQAPQVGQQSSLGSPLVTGGTGAEYSSPYSSLYGQGVINPTLAAYDQQAGMNMNARHAAADAGSAFGDRAAVGDAAYGAQSDVGRAALASQLATTGFGQAQSLGQSDAARALQAGTVNAGNQVQTGEFNNTLSNSINTGNADRSLSAATNVSLPATQLLGNNFQNQYADRSSSANSLGALGGMNFSQLIAGLGAGNPLFGSQSKTDASGSNQSTSSGSSSGKNGGLSFG